ncbi:tRNA-queuosine alpha-mannosyltransferase isoform X3 [Rhipicephalus microplus]|uniref:tRNA-queuosine alpha-mannosyltransferase isoform X3 n=1 Tax=Rhipicephalus microplus TaxID=6941 RepID=UPI003F6B99B9
MSVLLLEPFYGGSHKQLIDLLSEDLGVCRLVTLPPNKWHWRARTAALWLAERIEPSDHYRVLMASGTLNLAELLGLRQDLVPLRKVLYMHENQLAYPVQKEQLRDYQYGYNQVVSCLAADVVLFNSHFNRDSFLAAVEPFLNRVPGAGHLGPLRPQLEAKARVLSFPVKVPPLFPALYRDPTSPLHVVWPHRWEHDKGPEEFVQVLLELHCLGMAFHVSFLGQEFEKLPPSLLGVREELGGHIRCWGPLPDRDEYLALLRNADVVVSTALHEFYGVAIVVEAAFDPQVLSSVTFTWSFVWVAACSTRLLPWPKKCCLVHPACLPYKAFLPGLSMPGSATPPPFLIFSSLSSWKQACLAATRCVQIDLSTRRSTLDAVSTTPAGSCSRGCAASVGNPRWHEGLPPRLAHGEK